MATASLYHARNHLPFPPGGTLVPSSPSVRAQKGRSEEQTRVAERLLQANRRGAGQPRGPSSKMSVPLLPRFTSLLLRQSVDSILSLHCLPMRGKLVPLAGCRRHCRRGPARAAVCGCLTDFDESYVAVFGPWCRAEGRRGHELLVVSSHLFVCVALGPTAGLSQSSEHSPLPSLSGRGASQGTWIPLPYCKGNSPRHFP